MVLLKSFPGEYRQFRLWYTGPMTGDHEIRIEQLGPDKFGLTVLFGGQSFECGHYISRVAAMQAGRLFVERKQGESEGRKKRPRGKR